jgi:methyl-accepting chemotaxis protein
MKLSNLNIGIRLALGFTLVLILTALMTVVGIWRMGTIAEATQRMEQATHKEQLSQQWLRGIATNAVRTLALVKTTDADDQKVWDAQMKEQSAQINEVQKQVESLATTPEEKQLIATVAERRSAYLKIRETIKKVQSDGQEGSAQQARQMIDAQMLPAMNSYVAAVQAVLDHQDKVLQQAVELVHDIHASGRNILIALGVLAVVLGAALAWQLSRSITRPLREAVTIARTVASGDLTQRIDVRSTDETGQLMMALKEMNGSLLNIVDQVRHGTETIAAASTQIATGNLDLSTRTEEQASSLEETASSMEELTSTVRQNTENARQANQLAEAASGVAVKGGEVVSQVVETMASINDSSKKIVDIISVIDGIAFQTNILALNAAVEAARAGEQGRGFAVVAAEVRTLAQRSASAAKEIKELIHDSVGKVDTGNRLVSEAGTTMDDIVASIKRVTDIMAEIRAASEEQGAGIEQINQAVTQMDNVTQQNASLVEEAAAAAEALQDQARHLVQLVGVFKVDGLKTIVAPAQAALGTSKRPLLGA